MHQYGGDHGVHTEDHGDIHDVDEAEHLGYSVSSISACLRI